MKKKIEIQIPTTPNFIALKSHTVIPVSEFSDEELKEVGKEWIKELIKKAQKNRKLTL